MLRTELLSMTFSSLGLFSAFLLVFSVLFHFYPSHKGEIHPHSARSGDDRYLYNEDLVVKAGAACQMPLVKPGSRSLNQILDVFFLFLWLILVCLSAYCLLRVMTGFPQKISWASVLTQCFYCPGRERCVSKRCLSSSHCHQHVGKML